MSAAPARIVITGLGAVCAAGASTEEIWAAVKEGRSAIGPIESWDTSGWRAKNGAEVRLENRALVPDRKLHKIISRTDLLGLNAAAQAIEGSGLLTHRATLTEPEIVAFNESSGVFAGSGGTAYRSNH